MFLNQKLLNKLMAIILMATIGISCQKESPEPDAKTENQIFSFQDQDSLNVSEDVAISAALNFGNGSQLIGSNSNLRTASQEVEIDEVIIIPDEQGEPALYVINYVGTGYIILSATLKESPVLGFSDAEHFNVENIPLGMAEWFYDRMNKIQIIKSDSSYQIPEEVYGEWSEVLGTNQENGTSNERVANTIEQHGPLLTTLWGQGAPYNNLVPLNCGSGKAPAGCTATATAQIARYHAKGSQYNWSAMPTSIFSGRTTYGDNEVARLFRDIGIIIGMNYGCEQSGAKTTKSVNFYRDYLKYASGGTRKAMSIDEAKPIVISDIKNRRPVLMVGYHTTYQYTTGWWLWEKTHTGYKDGHTWVCDGYKVEENTIVVNFWGTPKTVNVKSDYYHMNWGWSGSGMWSDNNNGWFRFSNLEINGITTKGENRNYQHNRIYVTGIRP